MTRATRAAPARLERRAVVSVVVAFAVAAVAVGVVWWRLAEPPTWVAVQGRGYADEVQRTRVFGVLALYLGLSAVPSLLLGGVVGWVLRWTGWRHVALLAVCAAVAAVVSWQVGLRLGPPDPAGRFGNLADGTRVPGAVTIDAYGVLLVWPLASLLALLVVGVVLVPDDPHDDGDDDSADDTADDGRDGSPHQVQTSAARAATGPGGSGNGQPGTRRDEPTDEPGRDRSWEAGNP